MPSWFFDGYQPGARVQFDGLRGRAVAGFQLVQGFPDVAPVLVRVADNHRQGLVSADSLHRRQIDTGLHKMRDSGVAQGVADHLAWIQPGGTAFQC